jgi:hypothetical protein
VQQFQPLRRYRYRQYCHARSIAAWPVKAGDKTEPNWVGAVEKTIGIVTVAAFAASDAEVPNAATTVT